MSNPKPAKPYRISYEQMEAKGIGCVVTVVTLHEVASYDALLKYEYMNEDVTIVVPSPTCTEQDLEAIKEHCDKYDYNYEPPSPAPSGNVPIPTQCGDGGGEEEAAAKRDPPGGSGGAAGEGKPGSNN